MANGSISRRTTVFALALSIAMSALEATIVGTAMPTVVAHLGRRVVSAGRRTHEPHAYDAAGRARRARNRVAAVWYRRARLEARARSQGRLRPHGFGGLVCLTSMSNHPEAIALAYIDAVSTKRLDALESLIAPDVKFVGPAMTMTGRDALVAALRRISALHVRNDVKRTFSEGKEVCVIYDLVTDTVGVHPTIEWLVIEDGRIQSIRLFYDQLLWQTVREELTRRAKLSA